MDYDALKEQLRDIPITDICDAFDIEREGEQILCPAHNDRHMGSCRLFPSTNTFKCFACGAFGDGTRLVMYQKDATWFQAAQMIAEEFGIAFDSSEEIEEKERMPLSNEELKFIGLLPGTGRILKALRAVGSKPESGTVYAFDGENYILGESDSMSVRQLFYEDREAFIALIRAKLCWYANTYSSLYDEKIWTKPGFSKLNAQRVLEYAITLCQSAWEKMCAIDPEFPVLQFPVFIHHKKKTQLVV